MKKLNLGSGNHLLYGWDNLDIRDHDGVIVCDLTQPLPYSDNSISLIFSEHTIEHLDEVDGFNLLKESYRVLVSEGHIRISCPDLEQYVKAYLDWEKNKGSDGHLFNSGVNYLNYAMLGEALDGLKYINTPSRNHGHKYYYDERELSLKLEQVGFKYIRRCSVRQSEIPQLQNLEWRPVQKDLVMEATK